ncbi:hypothetical protein LTR27_011105 [Elasticomyces elasticus]|nr:hypothetical protein LTR27_011105 [Elasticomyces elasticus]
MPNLTRYVDTDRQDAVRGLLYLLQHHPGDLDTREKQAAAIDDLLTRHTFYHNGQTKERSVHNLTSLRRLAGDVAIEALLPSNRFEDKADVLCRKRLEGIDQDILKLYDYNRNTFQEQDLPDFEQAAEPAPVLASFGELNSFIQRATWIVLSDVEAVKVHSSDPDYKYRSKEHVLAALKHLVSAYDLRQYATDAHGKRDLMDCKTLYANVRDAYWAHNTNKPTRNSKNKRQSDKEAVMYVKPLWLTGKNRVLSGYLGTLEESAAYREERDGLQAYDENDAVAISRDVLSKLAELNIEHEQSDDTATQNQRQSDLSDDGLGWKDGMSKAELQRRLKKRKLTETASDEASNPNSPAPVSRLLLTNTPNASLNTTSRDPPQHDHGLFGTAHHVASHHKILEGSIEQLPQHPQGSIETHDPSTSSTYKSESPREETSPGAAASSSLPPPSTHADVGAVKLLALDLAEITSTMSDLHTTSQETVVRLLTALKLPLTQDSPIIQGLEPELSALFESCWGSEWLVTCESLRAGRFLTATDATRSLIAAFLYNNIFAGGPIWQDLLKRMVCFDQYMASVFEKQHLIGMFDDLFSEHDVTQGEAQSFGRELYADALTRFVADPMRLDKMAQQQSNNLAVVLLHNIEPYLRRLVSISESMNPHRVQQNWQETLQADLTDLIKQAVMLKARLVSASLSGFQHAFTWYSQGAPVDATSMRTQDGTSTVTAEQVAYTLFPGLQAQHPRGTISKVSFAEIVAQPQVPQA